MDISLSSLRTDLIAGRLDFIKEDRGAKERAQSYPTCITSCRPTNKENKDKGSAYRNTGQ